MTKKIFYYINPILTGLAGLTGMICFLPILWFAVAWLPALIQAVYGIVQYIRTDDTKYLHHVCSAYLVVGEYICMSVLAEWGYIEKVHG